MSIDGDVVAGGGQDLVAGADRGHRPVLDEEGLGDGRLVHRHDPADDDEAARSRVAASWEPRRSRRGARATARRRCRGAGAARAQPRDERRARPAQPATSRSLRDGHGQRFVGGGHAEFLEDRGTARAGRRGPTREIDLQEPWLHGLDDDRGSSTIVDGRPDAVRRRVDGILGLELDGREDLLEPRPVVRERRRSRSSA